MTSWQSILVIALLVLLACVLAVRSALNKRRRAKQQDFTRSLEMVLLPKETVKAICPGKKGRWVLTSKRLLLEAGDGFTAIPLNSIKRIQGAAKDGKATAAVAKMVSLTVKAEKDHTLKNTCPEFAELAKQLKAVVKKQNDKKKTQKEKKSAKKEKS